MDKHIKKFKDNGFKAVTRQNLYYRLKNVKSIMTIDKLVGKNLSISGDTYAVVSDLSGETFHDSSNNATKINSSTNSKRLQMQKKREDVIIRCATLYNHEREKAKRKGLMFQMGH